MYLWDLEHGFAGVVLIKKAGDNDKIKGCWDSIHVVEVQVGSAVHVDRSMCASWPWNVLISKVSINLDRFGETQA